MEELATQRLNKEKEATIRKQKTILKKFANDRLKELKAQWRQSEKGRTTFKKWLEAHQQTHGHEFIPLNPDYEPWKTTKPPTFTIDPGPSEPIFRRREAPIRFDFDPSQRGINRFKFTSRDELNMSQGSQEGQGNQGSQES
jgi:hypothetical protein